MLSNKQLNDIQYKIIKTLMPRRARPIFNKIDIQISLNQYNEFKEEFDGRFKPTEILNEQVDLVNARDDLSSIIVRENSMETRIFRRLPIKYKTFKDNNQLVEKKTQCFYFIGFRYQTREMTAYMNAVRNNLGFNNNNQ